VFELRSARGTQNSDQRAPIDGVFTEPELVLVYDLTPIERLLHVHADFALPT
jgi:hypothetical protein